MRIESRRVREAAFRCAARGVGPALLVVLGCVFPGRAEETAPPAFRSGEVGFSVRVKGVESSLGVLGIYVMPEERVTLSLGHRRGGGYDLAAASGSLRKIRPRRWGWIAPTDPGLYPIRIDHPGSGESMTLNAFVLVPRDRVRNGVLNGYRIGAYPSTPLKGLSIYKPPPGFVEVTRENLDTPVSPHFTLGQFLCKQDGDFPKYLVMRERLPIKLEMILKAVNAAGFRCDTFHVMSGYRTPFYNAAIGQVKYSRHVWGGGADIFIDESPRDGMMDDLNGDGKIDFADAAVLYRVIDDLYGRPEYANYMGGLARYKTTSNHGPFVHVDVRGFRARWGT